MSFFDKHASSQVEQFEEVVKGKTKEEVRDAEMHLLKPGNIASYDDKVPKHRSELASRTALIVFTNKAQQELIGTLFQIRTSVNNETYITDISLLEAMARGVKKGKYQIVDNEIQLVTGLQNSEHWHENEEGTIRIHLPDPYFEPLTDDQVDSLTKKQRKKYDKIVSWGDVKKMNKFRAKHFPEVKEGRKRRKF